ncbi:MAG TPA: tRNA pseudouridine(55) synthase TruB [Pyrinomonadaceae bacterium]|nr:tRNA pseudouridine(55) synthase TruB [Pyrinomonadaceae bacterium]
MDGILIIDKPAGLTSHDVVSRVRRILKTKRVGHTGTLDPFATGVLVVLVGKATRLAQFLDKDRKEYVAELQFGWTTDTGDGTGIRNAEAGLRNEELVSKLDATVWDDVLVKFRGDILQTPPMYSAKKVEGKKLYELAREGKQIERQAVPVTVHELKILPGEGSTRHMKVCCSAGTYVRTLAEDIGAEIGVGAHLIALRRTAAGELALSESITLDALQELAAPETTLLPLERAVSGLTEYDLTDERVGKTRNGLSTRVHSEGFADGQRVRLVDKEKTLIAIGIYDDAEKSIRPKVVLI